MTWLEHHKLSEESAQLAEAALRQQDHQQARTFYAQAAQAELLALADLDPTKLAPLASPSSAPSPSAIKPKPSTRQKKPPTSGSPPTRYPPLPSKPSANCC
jgi:hypothetical protein